jgi:hypothetical protein
MHAHPFCFVFFIITNTMLDEITAAVTRTHLIAAAVFALIMMVFMTGLAFIVMRACVALLKANSAQMTTMTMTTTTMTPLT